jgi:histidinol-phosphate aminotransferase
MVKRERKHLPCMTNPDDFVQPHIRALGAYVPGKPARQAERESGIRCIKMASNENPFGPSPRALEAMRAAAAEANFYPDNEAGELRAALAQRHGVEAEQVAVADGSTVLLDLLARTLLAPGLNAVTSERSFIVYPIATRAAGGRLIEVPMRDDAYDLEAILAAITPQTRIVYIANPNNPTGTMIPAPELERFLDRLPEHVLPVLDEAYCDFAGPFAAQRGLEYSRSLDYVRQGRYLVVLRTFSKAHGLAGARVGYAFGPATLLQYLARVRTAFSISGIAQAGALAALQDEAHIRRTVENNAQGEAWLMAQFRELSLRAVPTFANFIYLEMGEDSAPLVKRIQEAGVVVRGLGPWGIPTAFRVTIGTPEQNQRFIAALKKALAAAVVR